MLTKDQLSKRDRIEAIIEAMDEDRKVSIHNEYCNLTNNPDDEIFEMYMFDDIMGDRTPTDIAQLITYGEGFSPNDDYFGFTGYGNLWSLNFPSDSKIFASDIAVECVVRDEDFGVDAIREILDEEETDDDDA